MPAYVGLFANIYLSFSYTSQQAFREPLSPYFTVTVLATVDFGDIAPRTDVARIIVSVQMLLDLVLLGALVHLVGGAAKVGVARGKK